MAHEVFPVLADKTWRQVSCYWAKAPGYSEADTLKAWPGGETAMQRDATELARLAAMKWEATCEFGAVASSLAELESIILTDAHAEVTGMLIAEARWFEPGVLGVCLFHRTWKGNIFLDFLAAHPQTEGEIGGVGSGLLYHICNLSRRLKPALLWGETAANSAEFYQRAFGFDEATDRLSAPFDRQENFCRFMEDKWRGGR